KSGTGYRCLYDWSSIPNEPSRTACDRRGHHALELLCQPWTSLPFFNSLGVRDLQTRRSHLIVCATFNSGLKRLVHAIQIRSRSGEPGLILLFRDNAHGDRHEAMILAAKLGALAVIQAFLVRLEPCLVDTARNCIHLHAESRNGPGIDYIGGGDEEANRFPDWNHDFIVDG